MKKIIIYYFSGTGNTWWVANELMQQLRIQKQQVECYSIETLNQDTINAQIQGANHIILGFPVYGSTAPRPILNFIENSPIANNKQSVSVFATHALASGDSAYFIGSLLVKKGYTLKQTLHIRMMNNFHIPKFRFYRPKNDYRVDKLLHKAQPKINKLAGVIMNEQEYIIGNNFLGRFLGQLQRKHIDKVIDIIKKDFKVDASRCIDCGKCVKICPTKNIEKQNTSYLFGDNCALCLRCYSQCPKAAILIGEASKNELKYPRYKGPGETFNVNILFKKN